jgi:hypothetical protein|tara:strand:+ start:366 stop:800 length:435 start_codon:yes stop_codon:yes gene_type:complete
MASSYIFAFANGASKIAGGFFLVTQVTQVISAAVFAGIDTNNYCKLNDQISSLQSQIAATKTAWNTAIADAEKLDQDFIKDRNQEYKDLILLQKQYMQTQDEYDKNKRRFSLSVFILVLLTASNLFLNYFIKKQKTLVMMSKHK